MRLLKWLDAHAEEALLAALLALIACVELAQVIFRNLPFAGALTWAEEFCRFMWIWSVFLSLPFTIRKASMLRVSVLSDVLPQTARAAVNIAVDLLSAAVMALLFRYSLKVVFGANGVLTSGEVSPAMRWPMWTVYLSMLIGFGFAIFRAVQMAVIHTTRFSQPDAADQAEGGRP